MSRLRICFLGSGEKPEVIQELLEGYSSFYRLVKGEYVFANSGEMEDDFHRNLRGSWEEEEEEKIKNHGSVFIVESLPYSPEDGIARSLEGLRLIRSLLINGVLAAMVEGSKSTFSGKVWSELAQEADDAEEHGDRERLSKLLAFALVRRGVAGDYYYETLGYHFLGLPEIYIPLASIEASEVFELTEQVTEDILTFGIEHILEEYRAEWEEDLTFSESEVEYNPYGVIYLTE